MVIRTGHLRGRERKTRCVNTHQGDIPGLITHPSSTTRPTPSRRSRRIAHKNITIQGKGEYKNKSLTDSSKEESNDIACPLDVPSRNLRRRRTLSIQSQSDEEAQKRTLSEEEGIAKRIKIQREVLLTPRGQKEPGSKEQVTALKRSLRAPTKGITYLESEDDESGSSESEFKATSDESSTGGSGEENAMKKKEEEVIERYLREQIEKERERIWVGQDNKRVGASNCSYNTLHRKERSENAYNITMACGIQEEENDSDSELVRRTARHTRGRRIVLDNESNSEKEDSKHDTDDTDLVFRSGSSRKHKVRRVQSSSSEGEGDGSVGGEKKKWVDNLIDEHEKNVDMKKKVMSSTSGISLNSIEGLDQVECRSDIPAIVTEIKQESHDSVIEVQSASNLSIKNERDSVSPDFHSTLLSSDRPCGPIPSQSLLVQEQVKINKPPVMAIENDQQRSASIETTLNTNQTGVLNKQECTKKIRDQPHISCKECMHNPASGLDITIKDISTEIPTTKADSLPLTNDPKELLSQLFPDTDTSPSLLADQEIHQSNNPIKPVDLVAELFSDGDDEPIVPPLVVNEKTAHRVEISSDEGEVPWKAQTISHSSYKILQAACTPTSNKQKGPRNRPITRKRIGPVRTNRAIYEANYYNRESATTSDSDVDDFIVDSTPSETSVGQSSDSTSSSSESGNECKDIGSCMDRNHKNSSTGIHKRGPISSFLSLPNKARKGIISSSDSDEDMTPNKILQLKHPVKVSSQDVSGPLRVSKRIICQSEEKHKLVQTMRELKNGQITTPINSEVDEESEGETYRQAARALMGHGGEEEGEEEGEDSEEDFIVDDIDNSSQSEGVIVTCRCGLTRQFGTMVTCTNERCGKQQHLSCVGYKTIKDVPSSYLCPHCDPEAFLTNITSNKMSRLNRELSRMNKNSMDNARAKAQFVEEDFEQTLYDLLEPGVEWERVKDLIERPGLNMRWRRMIHEGKGFLHKAAANGLVQAVERLLDLHAGADDEDINDWLPLHHAIDQDQLECVKLLWPKIHPELIDSITKDGLTLLHLAAKQSSSAILCYLLNHPDGIRRKRLLACMEERDADYLTPLGVALCHGSEECTEILLENGAKVTPLDEQDASLFHIAAAGGSTQCLELLASHIPLCELDHRDKSGQTPFMYAAQNGKAKALQWIYDKIGPDAIFVTDTENKSTPLHLAAIAGDQASIQFLLDHNHPVAPSDRAGWPPLLYANFETNEECVLALFAKDPTQLQVLSTLMSYGDPEVKANNLKCVIEVLTLIATVPSYYKVLNDFVSDNPSILDQAFAFMLKQRTILNFNNKKVWLDKKIANHRCHLRDQSTGRALHMQVYRDDVLGSVQAYLRDLTTPPMVVQVSFVGEEGTCRGPKVEMLNMVIHELLSPERGLFSTADNCTYSPCFYFSSQPSTASDRGQSQERLNFLRLTGVLIGLALWDGQLLPINLARHVVKQLLTMKVDYHDLATADLQLFQSFEKILVMDDVTLAGLGFKFEVEVIDSDGVRETREIIKGGSDIDVTVTNRKEYVDLYARLLLCDLIRPQIEAIREGIGLIIPLVFLHPFSSDEFTLLVMGTPSVDIADWKANTIYRDYNPDDNPIVWLWELLDRLTGQERLLLLKFVTGTVCVPMGGFKNLIGLNGIQPFTICRTYMDDQSLPTASTCFNLLKLPPYSSRDILERK
eukprot:Ihof_evm4s13 gene=Ihof_evmTU4s13